MNRAREPREERVRRVWRWGGERRRAAGAQSPGGAAVVVGSRPRGQSTRVSRGVGIRRGRGFIERPVTREGGTWGGRGEGREAEEEGGERDGPRRGERGR